MAEMLGVQSGRFWREAELDILKADYPRMGLSVTERLPGRLGLKKSRSSEAGFRPWSDEEWALLEKNMHLRVAELQATLFPDRTKRAVEKVRGRFIKNTRINRGL